MKTAYQFEMFPTFLTGLCSRGDVAQRVGEKGGGVTWYPSSLPSFTYVSVLHAVLLRVFPTVGPWMGYDLYQMCVPMDWTI